MVFSECFRIVLDFPGSVVNGHGLSPQVSSISDWQGNGKQRKQLWDGTHMVFSAKRQAAKVILAMDGRVIFVRADLFI